MPGFICLPGPGPLASFRKGQLVLLPHMKIDHKTMINLPRTPTFLPSSCWFEAILHATSSRVAPSTPACLANAPAWARVTAGATGGSPVPGWASAGAGLRSLARRQRTGGVWWRDGRERFLKGVLRCSEQTSGNHWKKGFRTWIIMDQCLVLRGCGCGGWMSIHQPGSSYCHSKSDRI